MLTAPGQAPPKPGDGIWDEDTWHMAKSSEEAALETLMWTWGEFYDIGVDDGLWWSRRRDGKGGTETASSPEHLRNQLVTDYFALPIRHASPPTSKATTSQDTP